MKRLRFMCYRSGALLPLFRQRRSATISEGHSSPSDSESKHPLESAPVMAQLYSIQQYHKLQSSNSQFSKCKQLEQQAWSLLQDLEEAEVKSMPTNEIAELLSAWCYFARFWDEGMNGPSQQRLQDKKEGDQEPGMESILKEIPLVTRKDNKAEHLSFMEKPRRPNPLDEILDF
ncbi:unnamed protein product [Phytomonas sp. Hart1]|nr:unnamed protein product [Phytomonas sp. Hart1]|eukprot:CCW68084.1 unnamed protein product [Phytomonas sp. isolate Hart1]